MNVNQMMILTNNQSLKLWEIDEKSGEINFWS